ncbi:general negative regulator of transcription subunit 3-like protein, partial [Trifolium pratense]
DKIGEQQQHQNFPDEPTTESTSSTWIGKNLIVEDDMKSPHDVDSSAGVSASLPEAAYGCVSASALSKP